MVARNLLNEVLALPPAERLQLVRQVWDSLLEDRENLPISEDQRAELDRRYDEYLANPGEGESWEQVGAYVKVRLRA
jgi:putative addiction module component (TIGR02574 family)